MPAGHEHSHALVGPRPQPFTYPDLGSGGSNVRFAQFVPSRARRDPHNQSFAVIERATSAALMPSKASP